MTRTALQAYFLTKWAAAGYSDTLVKCENAPFSIPDTADWWVGLFIRESQQEALEMGLSNVAHDHTGLVMVQFFYLPNTGTGAIEAVQNAVSGWFRGEPVSGYHFKDPVSVFPGGRNKDGWEQANINYPFSRIETHNLSTP